MHTAIVAACLVARLHFQRRVLRALSCLPPDFPPDRVGIEDRRAPFNVRAPAGASRSVSTHRVGLDLFHKSLADLAATFRRNETSYGTIGGQPRPTISLRCNTLAMRRAFSAGTAAQIVRCGVPAYPVPTRPRMFP